MFLLYLYHISPLILVLILLIAAFFPQIKKAASDRRKIEREIERTEKEIAALEEKQKELHAKMSLPEVYSNGEKARAVQLELEKTESEIEKLTAKWEELSESLA